MKPTSLVRLLIAFAVTASSSPAFAAIVAHEGFDNMHTVTAVLTTAGHTATALTPADVENGVLLSGGYEVFAMSRNSVTCGGPTQAYADAVEAFVYAGGNIVTEWNAGPMFFTDNHASVTCGGAIRLGTFAGTVHAGNQTAFGMPIDLVLPSHPVVAGISDPMVDGSGTEFMFWIENPDGRLDVVGEITGTGGNFPSGQDLPVVFSGCSGQSRFVFGLHDWNDTLSSPGVSRTFFLNSVAHAAEGCNPCPPTPATGCAEGEKASLLIVNNENDEKDGLKWKLSKAGALDQAMLGDPISTRTYGLCIYDETGGSASLAASFIVAPSDFWVSKDPKGFKYADKPGSQVGVTKIAIKPGDEGKSSAAVQAKGLNLALPAAATGTEFFDQDTRVIVQLVNNETPTCLTSEFTTNKSNTATVFKASAP